MAKAKKVVSKSVVKAKVSKVKVVESPKTCKTSKKKSKK